MNNIELVTHMMNFSKAGGLKQAFIIEAIRVYSEMTLQAPPWPEPTMISQEAWKVCAEECLKELKERS